MKKKYISKPKNIETSVVLSIQELFSILLKQMSPDDLSLEKSRIDSFSLRDKIQSNLPIHEYYEEFPFYFPFYSTFVFV